jgi:hypothetical protein
MGSPGQADARAHARLWPVLETTRLVESTQAERARKKRRTPSSLGFDAMIPTMAFSS